PMASFRPGIGIEQINAHQRSRRKPGEHVDRIALMNTNIGGASCGDGAEELRHTVDERLDPDEADMWVGVRLRYHVLPTPEADLHPQVLDRDRKQRAQRLRFCRQVQGEPRQQALKQRRARRPQTAAPATAEDRRSSVSARHAAAYPRGPSSPTK